MVILVRMLLVKSGDNVPWHTHHEKCDMLSTFGAYNSQAGTDTREYALRYSGRRRPDDMFHASCSVSIDRKCNRTVLVKASGPRTA